MNAVVKSTIVRGLFLVSMVLMTSFSVWASDNGSEVLGVWQGDNEQERFEIYKRGDLYYGRIVWTAYDNIDGGPLIDSKNPDVAKRNDPIVGLEILIGFKYKGNGVYVAGRVYDPGSGNTYKCKIKVNGDMAKVRGFVLMPMLGRTEIAYRYSE